MDLLGIFEGRKLGAIALSGKDMMKKWVLKEKFEGEGRGLEHAGGLSSTRLRKLSAEYLGAVRESGLWAVLKILRTEVVLIAVYLRVCDPEELSEL